MPDVHRVSRMGMVNAYLVREDDGLTLIDTMLPRSGTRRRPPLRRPVLRSCASRSPMLTVTTSARSTSSPESSATPRCSSARDARLLARDKSLDPDEPQDKLRGSYPAPDTDRRGR